MKYITMILIIIIIGTLGIQSRSNDVNLIPVEQNTSGSRVASTLHLSAGFSVDHHIFDRLLSRYISQDGRVDYRGFKKEKAQLQTYLDHLAENPPGPSWTRQQKLAYWINAYNAFTIKLIIDHYPVNSVTDLYDGNPWDIQWIEIGNRTYSLNNIENDIIRPEFGDARIHFAVNCAARSCPPLANKAYTAQNLESMLNDHTKQFINNKAFNSIASSRIEVSKIFEWYSSDFGDLIDFLNKYSETGISSGASIHFREYDWSLNSK